MVSLRGSSLTRTIPTAAAAQYWREHCATAKIDLQLLQPRKHSQAPLLRPAKFLNLTRTQRSHGCQLITAVYQVRGYFDIQYETVATTVCQWRFVLIHSEA